MYYLVKELRNVRIPKDYHLFGKENDSDFYAAMMHVIKQWQGFTGEMIEKRVAEENSDATRIRLRFSDGTDAWFFPWMIQEVQDPRFHPTLPPIYDTEGEDSLEEIIPIKNPQWF